MVEGVTVPVTEGVELLELDAVIDMEFVLVDVEVAEEGVLVLVWVALDVPVLDDVVKRVGDIVIKEEPVGVLVVVQVAVSDEDELVDLDGLEDEVGDVEGETVGDGSRIYSITTLPLAPSPP